jgi:hypothetical protein
MYSAFSLTRREERRLKVFENRVLRRIFGPKREEVAVGWRGPRNEELRNVYTSPNIIRVSKSSRVRWAGHIARMGAMIIAYSVLVGKPEENIPLERRKCRWGNNIRIDLREIGWEDVDWMHPAQD